MRIDERLIIKLTSIYGSTTSPITFRHISALDHKVLDDPMERAPLVMQRLVPIAYRQKIVHRFRDRIIIELHQDAALSFAPNTNVEEGALQAFLVVDGLQRVRACVV